MKASKIFIILFIVMSLVAFSETMYAQNHNIEDEGLVTCGKGKNINELNGSFYDSEGIDATKINVLVASERIEDGEDVYFQSPPNSKGAIELAYKIEGSCDGRGSECKTLNEARSLSECGFQDAGNLFIRVVNWLIFIIAPTAVVVFVSIGGFIILTMGGESPSQRTKGINMIKYAFIGYVIIILSVFIVDQVIEQIGVSDNETGSSIVNWRNIDSRF